MVKLNLFRLLATASAMLFVSCNNGEDIPDFDQKEATVKITIAPSSRASSETENGATDENKITKVEAYLFIDEILFDFATSPTTSVILNGRAGAVTIVVVANAETGRYSAATVDYTLSALKAALSTHAFGYADCTTVPSGGFVMSGLEAVTLVEGANSATLNIVRTVSKFEKPVFSGEELLEIPAEQLRALFPGIKEEDAITFTFDGYALANGLNKTPLFNEATCPATPWPANRTGWIPGTLAYLDSRFNRLGNYDEANGVYSGGFIANAADAPPLYVHENFPYPDHTPAGSHITGYNPKEVYCFIIKGTLGWGAMEIVRYWRVNLVKRAGDETVDYKICRNRWYKVSFIKIKSIGWNTPKEAEEEKTVILIKEGDSVVEIAVDVADWDVYPSSIEMI